MNSSDPTTDPIIVGTTRILRYFAVFGIRFQKPIAPAIEPGQRATELVAFAMFDGIRNPTVRAGKVIREPPPATALIPLAIAPRQNRIKN